MTGPEDLVSKKWKELEQHVTFKELPQEFSRYLGTNNVYEKKEETATLTTQMTEFLHSAVAAYCEETGVTEIRGAATPYHYSEATEEDLATPGAQAPTAASHLMKILYAARMCRPDLTTGVARLAPYVSNGRWTRFHDLCLGRLMGYISKNADRKLVSTLGPEDLPVLKLCCYVDADLAGDRQHTRSQSVMYIELVGAREGHRWPLAWASRKQPVTAGSSGAAELLAMAAAMRKDILPLQYILVELLGRPVEVDVLEDTSACLQSIKNGYSPSMRDLTRTLRISIEALHELHTMQPFGEYFGNLNFKQVGSGEQKADVFTKMLQNQMFQHAVQQIGIQFAH